MIIHGLQKLTMLDYPGHVAATVFTAGCNFRCPFCHNAALVTEIDQGGAIEEAQVLAYLTQRRGILDGVCVTGGEPILQPDLSQFLEKVKDLGLAVKLDTNGSQPDKLRDLLQRSLIDYVAMDIKNGPTDYAATAGMPAELLPGVKESVALLLNGNVEYEFRTTIVREFHDAPQMREIGEWIRGAKRYFLQNFVDSGKLIDANMHGHTPEKMRELLQIVSEYVPNAQLRGL